MNGAALPVGGFYAHFSSKDELVDEALRRTGAELRNHLVARLDEKPEADRPEVILKRYLAPCPPRRFLDAGLPASRRRG